MNLKQKINNNKVTIGTWITIGNNSIVEILATADFDWMAIDMEHSSVSIEQAQNLISTMEAKGVSPLVRVGKNDDLIIKQVMDAGAYGVIIPMISSKEDALRAVSYVNYPPKGTRGVGLSRAQNYGIGFNEYKNWLNNDSIIIAQIEHKDAVENIEEIIAVKGIDAIIIGPYDMSASYGCPGDLENDLVLGALKKIEETCIKNNFPLGYHVIRPDHLLIIEKIKKGYTFLGFSLDFYFLGESSRLEMERIKNEI